jgi:hypothetical protein
LMKGKGRGPLDKALAAASEVRDNRQRADILTGIAVLGSLRYSPNLLKRLIRSEAMKESPNISRPAGTGRFRNLPHTRRCRVEPESAVGRGQLSLRQRPALGPHFLHAEGVRQPSPGLPSPPCAEGQPGHCRRHPMSPVGAQHSLFSPFRADLDLPPIPRAALFRLRRIRLPWAVL